jgi:aminoglycoside phosphotransferase (APT) family kinase protein
MATTRANTLAPDRHAALAAWLATALELDTCAITSAALLTGGAVQENWRLDIQATAAGQTADRTIVLRTDAVHRLPLSIDRTTEFAVLKAARRAGVVVAEPLARSADPSVIGAPFLVQAFATGTAEARRIIRDPNRAEFGPGLARSLGHNLALLQRITPETARLGHVDADLARLPVPLQSPAKATVAQLRRLIDTVGEPRPALEHVLVWLDANAPDSRRIVLAHGDFRTGNYLVDGGRLTAILDWEFAHWSDPVADLGWLTAPCWRFGSPFEAGGISGLDDVLSGYVDGGAERPTPRNLAYWQIMAAARWAAIALLQAGRFHDGDRTLEAALTGLMPPEMELEALDAIAAFPKAGLA